jgi:CHAD domain-containing protein
MPSVILDHLVLPPIRRGSFAKRFDKSANKMEDNVRDYLIDPNEENIHDLRTSIRRFDSCFRLLPNGVRKKPNLLNSRASYKNLFKINSEIRDIDIICSKFAQYPQDVTSNYPDFLETQRGHRDRKLREAKELALSIYNRKPLQIKKGILSKKKLRRRYKKVVARFVNEIEAIFPLVVSDIKRRSELHELRKDCKKLRYTLEATDTNSNEAKDVISLLEGMQDFLGTIHDCDTMLLHLARAKGGIHARISGFGNGRAADYSDLIDLEQKERVRLYYEFVSKYGNFSMQQSSNFSNKKSLPIKLQ